MSSLWFPIIFSPKESIVVTVQNNKRIHASVQRGWIVTEPMEQGFDWKTFRQTAEKILLDKSLAAGTESE